MMSTSNDQQEGDDTSLHHSLHVRSILSCPSVTSTTCTSSSLPGVRRGSSIPSAVVLRKRPLSCRLVATHNRRTCHLISHSCPDGKGSQQQQQQQQQLAKVARCRINFDKELGAVALATSGEREKANEDEPVVLFVADISGRLWRSNTISANDNASSSSLAFADGSIEVNATAGSKSSNGQFEMAECAPQKTGLGVRKHRRCLPLGVDLLSIRRSGDNSNDSGTFLVAAGSQSILPPVVVYVPNDGSVGEKKNVIVEEISGLEATTCQIVSVLFVSQDSLGTASWRRLVLAPLTDNDSSSKTRADSAVLFGMSNGSIYCSLVSAVHTCTSDGSKQQVESINVTSAVPIFRLGSQQVVTSMFLVPGVKSSRKGHPVSLLVCVGCLGAVAILDWAATDAPGGALFASLSLALPRFGTWTSVAPFQCYRPTDSVEYHKQHQKPASIELSILATCDAGSTYVCSMRMEQAKGYHKITTTPRAKRLPLRKDVALATTLCFSGNTNDVDGMYLYTFSGSLLAMQVEEGKPSVAFRSGGVLGTELASNKKSKATDVAAKPAASDSAIAALKQLCNVSFGVSNDHSTIAVANDDTVNSMYETRNAERIISLNAAQNSRKDIASTTDSHARDDWFQTCHVKQPMLQSHIQDAEPLMVKDLAPLYFKGSSRFLQGDRNASTKVTYAGATVNHCASRSAAPSYQESLQASLWNRRPLQADASLSSTFEHSGESGTSLMLPGTRIPGDISNRKRKFVSSVVPLGMAKSAHSSLPVQLVAGSNGKKQRFTGGDEILGLVTSSKADVPALWSVFGDTVSEMIRGDVQDAQMAKRRGVGGSCFVDAERHLIDGMTRGNKIQTTSQSIMLSSSSGFAKRVAEEGLASQSRNGIDSVSIGIAPRSSTNGSTEGQQNMSSSLYTLRHEIQATDTDSDDMCSTLALLRSSIVGILSERLAAPGNTAIPLSEIEAANLLDVYHQAVKNPRTRKMGKYLMSKVDECILALKSSSDGGPATSSILRLYNQLRAIPLPLG